MSTATPEAASAAGAGSSSPESSLRHYASKLGRICVECGGKVDVPEKGPGQHKKFCTATCKSRFANREKAQGAVLITLAKTHALTRHSKDPNERILCGDVRTEMMRILKVFLDEDRDSGRADRLPAYARTLVNVDDSYRERRRRRPS